MARKYGFIFLISVVIIVLQQALFSRIEIVNCSFDIVYVFIICFALVNGGIDSIVFALFCGLIRDSFFPYVFGINTILYILSAYLITQIHRRIFRDALIIPITVTFVFTLFKGLLYYAYLYISSIKFDFIEKATNVILLEALYNAIISIIIYKIVKKVSRFKIMQREWKF